MAATQYTLALVGDGSLPTGAFIGASGSGAGGWGAIVEGNVWNNIGGTDTAGTGVASYMQSQTAGDYLQYTLPTGTKSVWLIVQAKQKTSGTANRLDHALAQVQIGDGSTFTNYGPLVNLAIDSPIGAMQNQDVAVPLIRSGATQNPLLAGSGRVIRVLVSSAAFNFLAIEGILTIQAKGTATAGSGIFSAIGDSWTRSGGGSNLYQSWPSKLANILQDHSTVPITYTLPNLGQDGDQITGGGGFAARVTDTPGPASPLVLPKTGGMYKIITNWFDAPPEYGTFCYFTNDLSTASVGWYLKTLRWAMMLLEDGIDLVSSPGLGTNGNPLPNACRIAVPIPGHHTPAALASTVPLTQDPTQIHSTQRYYSQRYDSSDLAVATVPLVLSRFPAWMRMVDLASAMDGRSRALYPNASSPYDPGNHPNDMGTSVIAEMFASALLGY